MIQKLRIRNFQCHKRLDLDLDPGVNAVVGPSDVGKSAIIRALYWLAFNEPGGTAFRSHWGGRTVVDAVLDDGTVVRRVRSDKDNFYQVGEQKYRGFGRKVPQEVQRALNLTDLNFHRQLDSPFLLADTPTQVAKRLNSIANLEAVDVFVGHLSGQIRAKQADIRSAGARLAQLEEDSRAFENLGELQELVEQAEGLQSHADKVYRKRSALEGAVQAMQRAEQRLKQERDKFPDGIGSAVERALAELEKLDKLRKQECRIDAAVNKVCALDDELAEARDELKTSEQALHAELAEGPCPLCGRTA